MSGALFKGAKKSEVNRADAWVIDYSCSEDRIFNFSISYHRIKRTRPRNDTDLSILGLSSIVKE